MVHNPHDQEVDDGTRWDEREKGLLDARELG